MTMPEDDKTWMSIESRYHSLEFDYAPTPEQVRAYLLPTRNHGSCSGFVLIHKLPLVYQVVD